VIIFLRNNGVYTGDFGVNLIVELMTGGGGVVSYLNSWLRYAIKWQ
jgi:hypothetical protein